MRIFLATSLLLPALCMGASFECAKASTKVERLICGEADLSELDKKLAEHYEKAIKETPFPQALRDDQRSWLREVRNGCLDTNCLRNAYALRVQKFLWITKMGRKTPICEKFRLEMAQRFGLARYVLTGRETGEIDYNYVIPDIDIDADKVNDKILLFQTGSASLIPPDNSSIKLIISSTRKSHELEAQRIFVIDYSSKYYAVSTNWHGEFGPVRTDVSRLEPQGINKICSYECGLVNGQCGQ